MSYKSILFFIIVFGIISFGYFYYQTFLKYFPIHLLINFFVLIFGLLSLFFPHIIKKLRCGDDIEDIKEFIIYKYKKK
jgi:hypothetical protein